MFEKATKAEMPEIKVIVNSAHCSVYCVHYKLCLINSVLNHLALF